MNKIPQNYHQQMIMEGIKGLPSEILSEILDFICFMRKKALYPQEFEKSLEMEISRQELKTLSQQEQEHLEKEFEKYDQIYPKE